MDFFFLVRIIIDASCWCGAHPTSLSLSRAGGRTNTAELRAFELKPDAVGTKHFGIGSGVAKLRLFVSEHYLYPQNVDFLAQKHGM